MFELKKDAWSGWPKCYYDPEQKKDVQAPEYGGDGKKVAIAIRRSHRLPHSLPTGRPTIEDLQIGRLPRGLSWRRLYRVPWPWNRAPAPQGGYNVVFQPLKDGKQSGDWIVFADGFAGTHKDPAARCIAPRG